MNDTHRAETALFVRHNFDVIKLFLQGTLEEILFNLTAKHCTINL